MQVIILADNVMVAQLKNGKVAVTRPSILGAVATHEVSGYTALEIATFLTVRMKGGRTDLIQNVFPDMSDEDREFILSGITPEVWAQTFPNGDNEEVH